MKPELQEQLYKKYPKIFKQKDLSMKETCMCWGIETGDGWYNILDFLCSQIQKICDEKGKQVEAVQVKEKYGTLRFYTHGYIPEVEKQIQYAEYESSKTCERCGSKKDVTQTEGWITTICKKCLEKGK